MAQHTGAAGAWIIGIVGLFIVIVTFAAMSEPFAQIYSSFYNLTNDTDAHETMQVTKAIWNKLPIVLSVGVLLYIIVYSVKKEPDDYSL